MGARASITYRRYWMPTAECCAVISRASTVDVELPVERLEGRWKVSQNQTAETRAAVVRGLRERGRGDDLAMAELVGES